MHNGAVVREHFSPAIDMIEQLCGRRLRPQQCGIDPLRGEKIEQRIRTLQHHGVINLDHEALAIEFGPPVDGTPRPKSGAGVSCPAWMMPRRMARVRVK